MVQSNEFAEKNGLQKSECDLHPRTTGFIFAVDHLREVRTWMLSMTSWWHHVAQPDNTRRQSGTFSLGPFPRKSTPCLRYPVDTLPSLSPDAPWTPSPHCPLTPRGRLPHRVPCYPVDALPSLSPDAPWTPSRHCSPTPC